MPPPSHSAARRRQDDLATPPALDVVVVIPTLNEAAHIEGLVRQLLQDAIFTPPGPAAIWVLDGGSGDDTRGLVDAMAERDSRVRLIDNPRRTQSHAVNLAAELAAEAGARRLVRIDAHALYPDSFVSGLLRTLETEGADSVVVPMRTVGGDPLRDAAADLYNSWLGNGGSPHRSGKVRGFVEHGHHAAFRLDAFRGAGGYDTQFVANEDAELDKRLIGSGRRIFLENALPIDYIPRGTLTGFWKQMWRNGRFRVWTSTKHGERLGLRQLLPIGVALGVIGSLVLGLVWPPLALGAALYVLLVTALAIKAAGRLTPGHVGRIVMLAVISHLAFGLGALRGLAEMAAGARRRFRAV
ncbi:MAG: succinoglycan biosynthesis protein ExoA [Caulobacteraceae bacterium]|nr:succinoglycan biosynthesis protein ExoA [Caulobacteraceae bacterium]